MKKIFLFIFVFAFSFACGGGYTLRYPPTPWVDDLDQHLIKKPPARYPYKLADIADKQLYYQLERLGDLPLRGEILGAGLGINKKQEALNVNNFDEVADSTWFHNRIGRKKMSLQEIIRGPNKGTGPLKSGKWLVLAAKTEGLSPGLIIQDKRGDRYLLKFDPPGHWGLSSGAEIISTRFLYAAGYHVPENYIALFKSNILELSPKATTKDRYGRTIKFHQNDLLALLNRIEKNQRGQVRALASKFLKGEPVGPFSFKGTRVRDKNDRISHQHHRELRGYRVFSAFLNNSDARGANSLDMFQRKTTNTGYLIHNLIDFGGTLGSGGIRPKDKDHMYDYRYNYAKTTASLLTLGAPQYYWDKAKNPGHEAIGLFESKLFRPETWRPTYPNPAFQNMTHRDAFWATKILMQFSDRDIKAIVKQAQYGNAWVDDYMTKTLIERRDKTGRFWFTKLNPLDRFAEISKNEQTTISFADLGVESHLFKQQNTKYRYRWADITGAKDWIETREKNIPLSSEVLSQMETGKNYTLQIETKRASQVHWSPKVDLIIQKTGEPLILGLRRHY